MVLFRMCCVLVLFSFPALAQNSGLVDGTQTFVSERSFTDTLARLKSSIAAHKMGLVAEACADCGARNIGVKIPGNRVLMIFNPHFAVRMLAASVDAGVEAPLRIYVTEHPQETHVSYRLPSATFAPYGVKGLDVLASELDILFAAIIADALK